MNATRLLALPVAAALALGLTACGTDDGVSTTADFAPQSAPAASEAGGETTTPSASEAPSGTPSTGVAAVDQDDDDEITHRALRERLARVAVEHLGGGRVDGVERSDDRTHRYDVEVDDVSGDDDVTVEISDDFSVVRVDR